MQRLTALLLALLFVLYPVVAQALPTASPEEVGLSKERLGRIAPALARQIEAKSFPGAVAMVVRKGKIAYFETVGQLDPTTSAPMPKDAIFRLYSMTKPFTSVAAMMLVEEGRIRLTDPVGLYLPQLAKLDVLVQTTDSSGKTSFTTVPAQRPVQSPRCTGSPTALPMLATNSGFASVAFVETTTQESHGRDLSLRSPTIVPGNVNAM